MSLHPLFRAGDWVEVRPFSEVFKTLDGQGCLDGLPFMPEMVKYCGRRFRIVKSAHKTCDPTGLTDMRRMADAVHLETRCDGSGHEGCQARCQFFWKTAWLKRVDGPSARELPGVRPDVTALAVLEKATRYATEQGLRYRCQATEIVRATEKLSPRNLGQYVQDIRLGNVSFAHFVRHISFAVIKGLWGRVLRRLKPVPAPSPCPAIVPRLKVNAELNLFPGEFVKVKEAKEILSTLDTKRGPTFEAEMLRHCGHTHRILYRVNRIIDERTGKMIRLANDCVVLDNITCEGLDNHARLFCPRSCYYFWREAWLTRTGAAQEPPAELPPELPQELPQELPKPAAAE